MHKLTSKMAAALLSVYAARVVAQQPAESYLEFGRVVALSKRTVEVQIDDARLGRTVQRSFALSRETRADLVHVGDTVEVIYSPGNGEWLLERLISLRGGVPRIGPAPAQPSMTASRPGVPDSGTVMKVPDRTGTSLGRGTSASRTGAKAGAVTLPSAPGTTRTGSAPQPVPLGGDATPKVPLVRSIGLGGAPDAVVPKVPTARAIAQQSIGEQCERTRDWAAEPIRVAVLDFRYPTEREESHDNGTVGGGSGTAVADLVYGRLQNDPNVVFSRGDRAKVFRMDFAGAARVGRQLGVDAVLLGTFAPVEIANADPDFPPATQAYTLRAGIVETCTGELLYRLTSVACPAPAAGQTAPPCPGSEVTVKQAASPVEYAGSFSRPMETLLRPFDLDTAPRGQAGTAGIVTAAASNALTLRLASGAAVHVGDQLSIAAQRMAKNPTTNTIHVFKHEEIGRMTVERVAGGTASGRFAGDTPPLAGDAADLLTE